MKGSRYLLVINPISGTGNKQGLAEFVTGCMHEFGLNLDISYTTGSGDARKFSLDAARKGYAAVIAAGGDGTVNEVASALRGTKTVMGILPSGSGNGLARHLGIPLDPRQALNIILNQTILSCDYATVNDIPFFCTFGVGFDAKVSEAFSHEKKRGKFTYLRVMIREAKSYSPATYTINVNGNILQQKAVIIAVCNASQYGNNAYIAPKASIIDGELDVTIFHDGNPLELAKNSIDLFSGLISGSNKRIETFRTKNIHITCDRPMLCHIDGEPIQLGDSLDIRCHEKGLNIFCNGEPEFKPILTPIANTFRELQSSISSMLK